MTSPSLSPQLKKIYRRLFKFFGPQFWWPGETSLEIIVGAILAQNTNWGNVEKAIHNLKIHKCLTLGDLQQMSHEKLAELIKPSGFFNIKAKRLKNFISFIMEKYQGNISLMAQQDCEVLRSEILAVNGIGPETADSILLYALNKPVFVVDAYTKRIFSRHHLVLPQDSYETVQSLFMENFKPDVELYNEYHALIVRLAKDFCRTNPVCEGCPLASLL